MKTRILMVAAVMALISNSCSNGICKKGNGNMDVKEESFGSFEHVELDGTGDLTLVPIAGDGKFKLVTEADENIIGRLEAKLNGNTLTLKNEKCIRKAEIKYRLEVPIDLLSVSLNGAGDVSNEDTLKGLTFEAEIQGAGDMDLTVAPERLKLRINGAGDIKSFVLADQLEAEIDGAGDIDLFGSVNTAEGNINGAGSVKAFSLESNHWIVNINGSGDAEVNARSSLTVSIDGAGDVIYTGQPTSVSTDVDGSGSLRKR